MNFLVKIVKLIGALMISIGVGALVKNVLIMITPPGAKAVMRVCMLVGGYFLGGLAAKAASDAFEEKVDSVVLVIEAGERLITEEQKIVIEVEGT